jgi:hypothetical protein
MVAAKSKATLKRFCPPPTHSLSVFAQNQAEHFLGLAKTTKHVVNFLVNVPRNFLKNGSAVRLKNCLSGVMLIKGVELAH